VRASSPARRHVRVTARWAAPAAPGNAAAATGRSKATSWTIYKIAAKAVRLGTVEAADEATAMEKAVAELKVPANRLMAIRR
jgi:hypothetical protein